MLYFFSSKSFSYVSQTWNFYIFSKKVLVLFWGNGFLIFSPQKVFFSYFGKWNVRRPKLKYFLHFLKKGFSHILENGTFYKIFSYFKSELSKLKKQKKQLQKKCYILELELSSPKMKKLSTSFLKKLSYVSGGNLQALKNKKFLMFWKKYSWSQYISEGKSLWKRYSSKGKSMWRK